MNRNQWETVKHEEPFLIQMQADNIKLACMLGLITKPFGMGELSKIRLRKENHE